MTKGLTIGVIVILVILIVIAAVATLWLRRDLIECETTESPYCPQFTCPSGPNGSGAGTPAQRTDPATGKIVYSS
jgi:hypothetical protein